MRSARRSSRRSARASMPRAIWTGAISFGLVNVPVRMYSAIDEHKLHFNYIHDFVDYDEIDPIYFERTYYLGPQDGAEKVYALLVRAMEESGRAAIAKFVMRDRQHLGCLRVADGALLLEKMYFADEIRPLDGIKPEVKKGGVD